jgi:hypothetical protein
LRGEKIEWKPEGMETEMDEVEKNTFKKRIKQGGIIEGSGIIPPVSDRKEPNDTCKYLLGTTRRSSPKAVSSEFNGLMYRSI